MEGNCSSKANITDANLVLNLLGPEYHKIARVSILAVMIFFSLVGNCLVCYRLLGKRRTRKWQTLFLNLAIADLAVTCFTLTSQLIWEVMGRQWIAGDIFCRIFKTIQTLGLVSSTYLLVAVAIDRYFALVKPLALSPQPRNLAVGAWIASLIPTLPNMYIFREVRITPDLCYCVSMFYADPNALTRQIYMALVLSSIFIIPSILLIALYTMIIIELNRPKAYPLCSTFTSIPRARIKTLKLALAVFGAFIITNLPYAIQEMILAFGDPHMLDRNVVALFGVISASNSAINPIIYLTFHAKCVCWETFCISFKESWAWTSVRSNIYKRQLTASFSADSQSSRLSQLKCSTATSKSETQPLTIRLSS